ncbi:MAG: alpha/beta fold hydrolase [Candidatus Liptonbacteria bacterium]
MQKYPYRTRFKKEIVAEFLPPARFGRKQRVIILCDGVPGVPNRRDLMQYISRQGYWVFHPRYRGAWESGGQFMSRSPHLDVLDVIGELKGIIRETVYGEKFHIKPDEIFVIGGSFGGAAAILCSLNPRVKKVIANCPVVDWPATKKAEKAETSNKSYVAYLKESWGNGYRVSRKNWNKLYSGRFYNPMYHAKEVNPSKIIMFHAKDDPFVPWRTVAKFAKKTGAKLKLLKKGGHLNTPFVVNKYWSQINRFFKSK